MRGFLQRHYYGEAGIRELLLVSFPMMISQASQSLMLFTDRYLLTSLGKDFPAASMLGGFSAHLWSIFFVGMISYVNPLVAQYLGAQRSEKCASTLVHALLLVLLVYPFVLVLGQQLVPFYFAWAKTPANEAKLAISYFHVINAGAFFLLCNVAISSFFAGIGRPRIVMLVNLTGMLANIPLNIWFIKHGLFGWYKGIEGAAMATVVSGILMFVLFVASLFHPVIAGPYQVRKACTWDREVFKKLVVFGGPTGAEFFIIFFAFNTFITLFHSYGSNEALAMTITFNWDVLAFMPLWGLNLGLMSVVGRYLGGRRLDLALKATLSGTKLGYTVILAFALAFWAATEELILVFMPAGLDEKTYADVLQLATHMIRLVAFYCLAYTANLVVTATLRAAGDTRWCLWVAIVSNWSMLVGVFIAIRIWGWQPLATWYLFVAGVFLESALFCLRFAFGKWKTLRIV